MDDLITSTQNSKIKAARALRRRKIRQETGQYLVEGIRHVGAAVEANAPLDHLFYAPDTLKSAFALELIEACTAQHIPCYPTSSQVFESLADREGPQGILAVARQQWSPLEHVIPSKNFWGVAIQNPQDPGNVGTILRTMEAIGAKGLFLIDGGVDPYHPTAVRASMGALFHIAITRAPSESFLNWAGDHQVSLFGSSAKGAVDYLNFTAFDWPAILLVGSERAGLTPEIQQACKATLRLPMSGNVTSLNQAVSTGVLLYHMQANRS